MDRPETLSLAVGQTLGHYRIVGLLGSGGMGEVWEAQDIKLERRVALKVLPAAMMSSADQLERFEREAKALASLDHPNIVTIHSVDEADGVRFLTMGLVEGKTLTEMIPRQGLSLDRLLELSVPLTAAIAAAHDKGITHRDIKPGNVMVTEEGLVKVLDFGLAKVDLQDPIATEGPTQALTIEGSILGTTPYMSPEQIEGQVIDHRSDIFSLGIVLYEMATGERPFRGDSTGGLMSAILKESPVPLTEVRRDLPRQLGRIVGQCLEKQPRDRFQDARDLYNALRGLKREIDSEASSTPVVHGPARTPGPSKTHRRWLIVTTGIGLTLGLLWFGTRDADKNVEVTVETVTPPVSDANSAQLPMIAVLPFENLGKPDDDYFAIGMTEEITTRLASLHELGVIASTSARAYSGSDKTAQQIGEELGADYLVVGSVRWAAPSEGASRLRISPRLIRAADDEQIWAESYDRVMEDVFGIQSDIATRIVESLDVTLSDTDRMGLEARPTENMEAYDYYLKAIAVPGSFAAEEVIREERALARRAVELDPNFLAAWYLLAYSEHKLYGYGFDRSEEQRQRCWELAQRVSDLAVDSPATRHAILNMYYFHVERDYDRALEESRRLAELEPNNSSAHAMMAYALRRMGQFEEALIEIRKAQRLAPRDAHFASQVGSILSFLRRFDESMVALDKAIDLDPERAGYYEMKAANFWQWTGDVDSARQVLEAIPEETRLNPWDHYVFYEQLIYERQFREALAYLDSLVDPAIGISQYYRPKELLAGFAHQYEGNSAAAREAFERAAAHLEHEVELRPDDVKRVVSLGIAYAALGRKDEAIRLGQEAAQMVPLSREGYFGLTEVHDLAWIYTLVGDYDLAFEQLEILLSRPSSLTIPLLRLDPLWAPLLDLPRFAELEAEYGPSD